MQVQPSDQSFLLCQFLQRREPILAEDESVSAAASFQLVVDARLIRSGPISRPLRLVFDRPVPFSLVEGAVVQMG